MVRKNQKSLKKNKHPVVLTPETDSILLENTQNTFKDPVNTITKKNANESNIKQFESNLKKLFQELDLYEDLWKRFESLKSRIIEIRKGEHVCNADELSIIKEKFNETSQEFIKLSKDLSSKKITEVIENRFLRNSDIETFLKNIIKLINKKNKFPFLDEKENKTDYGTIPTKTKYNFYKKLLELLIEVNNKTGNYESVTKKLEELLKTPEKHVVKPLNQNSQKTLQEQSKNALENIEELLRSPNRCMSVWNNYTTAHKDIEDFITNTIATLENNLQELIEKTQKEQDQLIAESSRGVSAESQSTRGYDHRKEKKKKKSKEQREEKQKELCRKNILELEIVLKYAHAYCCIKQDSNDSEIIKLKQKVLILSDAVMCDDEGYMREMRSSLPLEQVIKNTIYLTNNIPFTFIKDATFLIDYYHPGLLDKNKEVDKLEEAINKISHYENNLQKILEDINQLTKNLKNSLSLSSLNEAPNSKKTESETLFLESFKSMVNLQRLITFCDNYIKQTPNGPLIETLQTVFDTIQSEKLEKIDVLFYTDKIITSTQSCFENMIDIPEDLKIESLVYHTRQQLKDCCDEVIDDANSSKKLKNLICNEFLTDLKQLIDNLPKLKTLENGLNKKEVELVVLTQQEEAQTIKPKSSVTETYAETCFSSRDNDDRDRSNV